MAQQILRFLQINDNSMLLYISYGDLRFHDDKCINMHKYVLDQQININLTEEKLRD